LKVVEIRQYFANDIFASWQTIIGDSGLKTVKWNTLWFVCYCCRCKTLCCFYCRRKNTFGLQHYLNCQR